MDIVAVQHVVPKCRILIYVVCGVENGAKGVDRVFDKFNCFAVIHHRHNSERYGYRYFTILV